jgi:S-adenosylmethionine hydrolase
VFLLYVALVRRIGSAFADCSRNHNFTAPQEKRRSLDAHSHERAFLTLRNPSISASHFPAVADFHFRLQVYSDVLGMKILSRWPPQRSTWRGEMTILRSRRIFLTLVPFVFACVACSQQPTSKEPAATAQPASVSRPTIVFMTDFGTANDAVAICRAVIFGIAPEVRLTDITHQVTPFSTEEASRFLAGVTPYYPANTVFLTVVDPGVGTSRKAIIAKSKKGQYFVAPDNGVLTPTLDRDGFDSAREITNQNWMIQAPVSSTFHGRDIFSPAAAHLAAGWDYNLVGPALPELVRLTAKTAKVTDKGIEGDLIGLDDPFGSLITDITREDFQKLGYIVGDKVPVQINKKPVTLPLGKTFMDVPVGDSLLYMDSRGRLGVAVNQGNYAKKFNVEVPGTIFIPTKHTPIPKAKKP